MCALTVGRTVETGSICAVVVTYFPDADELRRVLALIAPQVDHLLVVDNATSPAHLDHALSPALPVHTTVIRNEVNEGLGAAYNRAVRWARAQGCRYLLLMDQDSEAAPDMVERLLAAHSRLSRDVPVAAVGPCFIDAHSGEVAPFIRIGFPLNRRLTCAEDGQVECDFLISSGSLIELDVIDAVGGMDEPLFIDNVDIEWCFRARARGYRLYGIGGARMRHRIGDQMRTLPFGLGRVIAHSPIRLYYMMRNRVLLYRRPETPRIWVAQDVPRLVLKFMRLSVFIAPRARNARAMARGILDGWKRRSGPYTGSP